MNEERTGKCLQQEEHKRFEMHFHCIVLSCVLYCPLYCFCLVYFIVHCIVFVLCTLLSIVLFLSCVLYCPLYCSESTSFNGFCTKLGTYSVLRRVWNSFDFQGHRSKVTGSKFYRITSL